MATTLTAGLPRIRRSAIALALSALAVFQVSPAAASTISPTVYTGRGGYGSTLVDTNTSRHSILIRAYLTQDNGGSQTVGARVWLYKDTLGWVDLGWKTGNTLDVYNQVGATTYFNRYAENIQAGSYYVTVDYGWYTANGWDVRRQNVGWFSV